MNSHRLYSYTVGIRMITVLVEIYATADHTVTGNTIGCCTAGSPFIHAFGIINIKTVKITYIRTVHFLCKHVSHPHGQYNTCTLAPVPVITRNAASQNQLCCMNNKKNVNQL